MMTEHVAGNHRKLSLLVAGSMVAAVLTVFGALVAPVSQAQATAQAGVAAGPGIEPHAPEDIAGDWQGTRHWDDKTNREVLRISKTADGRWKTLLYDIDQNGQPMTASSTTLQGSTFKCEIPVSDHTVYEGKLSTDGNTIKGFWKQAGETPWQMDLVRATKETAWEIPPLPPSPASRKPMAADANPSFAVATIKPSNPNARGKGLRTEGDRFTESNDSLADLIAWSYGVHAKQVVGGPEWLDKDKYDIAAVVDVDKEGTPSKEQWKTMVQKLLADRFELAFHHDKKELPVYVLSAGKGGPKNLPKSGGADDTRQSIDRVEPGRVTLTLTNTTITGFALSELQGHFLEDRPVLDQTGLTGRFDFKLIFAPDPSSGEAQFGGPPKPDVYPAPDLFIAIQTQLGLKLDAVKAPADVMVIDHIERPTEN